MSGEEYDVETIIEARVHGKHGKKIQWRFFVKWKGYDKPEDNTWEPSESFEGGSEDMLANFWARVDAKGRDITDGSQFQTGETVYPIGPPRGKAKRKRVNASSAKAVSSVSETPAKPSTAPPDDPKPPTKRHKNLDTKIDSTSSSLVIASPSKDVDVAAKQRLADPKEGTLKARVDNIPDGAPVVHKLDRFSSLPHSILLRIFRIGVQLDKRVSFAFPCKISLPIRLSCLSQSLRKIVLAAPFLWTNLDDRVFGSPAMLTVFLKRSQDSSLNIDIDDFDGYSAILRAFKKTIAHVERWHHLSVSTQNAKAFNMIVEPLQSLRAPKLVSIKISCIGDECEGLPEITIFSGGTPALQSLDLSSAPCFPSDLETLTSVSLHCLPGNDPLLSEDQFYDYFGAMHSLTKLRLIGEVTRVDDDEEEFIDLPSLTSLSITPAEDYDACILIQPNCVSFICSTLDTTTLQHLFIDLLTTKILRHFIAFLREATSPPFPNVVSLGWETKISGSATQDLMRAFPKLEHLTLMGFQSDSFLKALTKQDKSDPQVGGSYYFPSLSRINVDWTSLLTLRQTISTRIKINKPIAKLRIHTNMLTADERKHKDWGWLKGHVKLESVRRDKMRVDAGGWVE